MVLVTTGLGFGLTYAFGYKDAEEEVTEAKEVVEANEAAAPVLTDETILSPIVGSIVDLKDVNDPVFSSGAMGQGIAVKPSEGVVYAPADAEVTIAFATGHAYGLKMVLRS